MLHLSLVCLLNNSNIKYRTTRVSSCPDYNKIKEIVLHNYNTLQLILDFCYMNNITSYRIPSNIIPLWTHPLYEEQCNDIFMELSDILLSINTHNIELSCHPDQFILLNSLNNDVNIRSAKELNKWGNISKYIPLKLLNIHIGGRQDSLSTHTNIIRNSLDLLTDDTKNILSFENDEKSYNIREVLSICERFKIMCVPDFHHQRCNNIKHNIDIDIVNYIDEILATYDNKQALPTFHISSPKFGWNSSFKDCCSHADYIDSNDFPEELLILGDHIDLILDVEAKCKQDAIFALKNEWF